MKNKPNDNVDNVDKIKSHISNTLENYNLTDAIIEQTDDEKIKKELIEKNERREEALNGMKQEIKEETIDKQKRDK